MKLTGATASYEFKDKHNTYRVDYSTNVKQGAVIGVYLNGGRHSGYTTKYYRPSRVSAKHLIENIK